MILNICLNRYILITQMYLVVSVKNEANIIHWGRGENDLQYSTVQAMLIKGGNRSIP